MTKSIARGFCCIMHLHIATLLLFVLSGCYVPGRGYHESSFDLVMGSRLPKFIDPDGRKNPAGYKATVDYYSSPNSVRFRIWSPVGEKIFDKHGQFWWHPKGWQPGQGKPQTYPSYNGVSIDGVVDIVEQRQPEPVLYLTDDKQVWESLGEPPTASETPANFKK